MADSLVNYVNIRSAFRGLGLDPREADVGGPNHCFTVIHCNGPAVVRNPDGSLPPEKRQHYIVNGRRYRVSIGEGSLAISLLDTLIELLLFRSQVATSPSV